MNRDKIHNLKSELVVEKPQFDISLGGDQVINSHGINYRTFVEYRVREITALSQAIEEPQRTTLIFQELPCHMRRRVMGHTSNRLPRMLREAHHNQLVKSSLVQQKKPNRKRKRRARNLLDEFNRRQKEFVWLETHMWHAKRFHMIEKWGYKIADFPNDKSFRACYRASSKHCLLQDVSFLCCVELTGPLDRLLEGLKLHSRPECGLTFAAKVHLSGAREGNVTLFRRNMFPFGVIGNVNFLWKPRERDANRDDCTEVRSLWIWVHPASYTEVLDEFISTFELKLKENQEETVPVEKSQKAKKNVEKTKLETRNVPYVRTPKYESDKGVTMVLLKDTLNRLRLTGPLSQSVLKEALCIPKGKSKRNETKTSGKGIKEETVTISKLTPASDIDDIFALMSKPVAKPASSAAMSEESSDEEMETDESKEHDWWTDFYKSKPFYKSLLKTKSEFWQSVTEKQSPAELPPNLVVGLTIVDPRLLMPLKRAKAVPDDRYLCDQPRHNAVLTPTPDVSVSEIWCPSVRDVASLTKLDVAELNSRRKRNLVPGFTEEEEEEVSTSNEHSRIPILLIQRPGCRQSRDKRTGFGSGWDVVVPAGWAAPLWMALVFRGARPGGQREAASLGREMADVDVLAPDSVAGRVELDARREKLTDQHFRLPPAKRPNFLKLGVSSPFSCAWDTLTREWASPRGVDARSGECLTGIAPGPYFVLRDLKTLLSLRDAANGVGIAQGLVLHPLGLVPVYVKMTSRGVPEDFALVCEPTEEDLALFVRDPDYPGPVEAQHPDDNEERRKTLRAEHKKTMKRLRRRRVRASKKLEGRVPAAKCKRKPQGPLCAKVVETYREMARHLWLPECLPVKDRCGRTTVGFVARGGFSLAGAGGAGVGYVPVPALLHLLTRCRGDGPLSVLVRNTTTYQYRFATLGVICPV